MLVIECRGPGDSGWQLDSSAGVYQSGCGARGVDVEPGPVALSTSEQQASFESFYEAEIDRQVRRAVLLLGSNDVANDVVHDAFIEIFRRWETLDDPGPYLHRAVLNRCRGVHRKRSIARRYAQRVATRPDVSIVHDGPLDDALESLPFNQRAAIVLRFYYDLTTEQIADELACAPGSVGPWIDRGLKKMRKALT